MAVFSLLLLLFVAGCKDKGTDPERDVFQLQKVSADNTTLNAGQMLSGVSIGAAFKIEFSAPADTASAKNNIQLMESDEDTEIQLTYTFDNENRRILVRPEENLDWNTSYQLEITDAMQSALGTEFPGIAYTFETEKGHVEMVSASINGMDLFTSGDIRDITFDDITFEFTFSEALNEQSYQGYFKVSPFISVDYSLSNEGKTVTVTNENPLGYYKYYTINVNESLESVSGFEFEGFTKIFQTGLNPTPKFPQLTNEELLTKVQEATFRYFWDFAHPVSGLARERNSSDETVTTGGSGFGLMAIITGIHRGFITRSEGVDRLQKIVSFLGDADRFHGAWSHWLNGSTGRAIAFSTMDDGGDLVETAFMAQGLITIRQFLDENIPAESELTDEINALLNTIEWDWYTKGGENVLYWHWSPNYEWAMNHQIKGYNEALIVYVIAASSTDHAIESEVYHQGWASSSGIENGGSFYGYSLPVGYDYGGPLFFSHYSFLGLNPKNLSDTYADYWTQNRNQSLINHEHSVINPNGYVGYSSESWGLTASDDPGGYGVHEPTRDNGTITPTAAISSIPYTPEESMQAIRHFYYVLGDKLWGDYGFYDAFNPTESWWANSYLAIDQGPIIIMIENYRSGLLWDLFMSAPEVQTALNRLDFTSQQ